MAVIDTAVTTCRNLSELREVPATTRTRVRTTIFAPLVFIPSLVVAPTPEGPVPRAVYTTAHMASTFVYLIRTEGRGSMGTGTPARAVAFIGVPILYFIDYLSRPVAVPGTATVTDLVPGPGKMIVTNVWVYSFVVLWTR